MNLINSSKLQANQDQLINFFDYKPKLKNMLTEISSGLQKKQKSISPKYFYDQRGSDLFQKITQIKEYYPTRTEIKIIQEKSHLIEEQIAKNPVIVEYGCGSSEKIFHLLEAINSSHSYLAIDISKEHLLEMTQDLAKQFPDIEIIALCADFTQTLKLPLTNEHYQLPRVAFFPGSSIGNFEPQLAQKFLKNIYETLGKGSGLLIGVDLKKDIQILEKAYNDDQGITAEFNKNLLRRINKECNANFNLEAFEHHAFYNEELGRIEMHLTSLNDQQVSVANQDFSFEKGESIHTENSYKYSIEEFQSLAHQAGWLAQAVWTDEKKLFSLHYFVAN